MNESPKISRRAFFHWLLMGGLLAWAAAFVAPVISYVWPSQKRGPNSQAVSAGKVDEFVEWQHKMIALDNKPVIVVRTPQGFRAFLAICTHLGCVVGWDAGRRQIACPVAGPPPLPLPELSVVVINDEVMVKSA